MIFFWSTVEIDHGFIVVTIIEMLYIQIKI